MRKILSLFLAAVLFCSLFCVPVEASQYIGASTTYRHDFKTSYYATLASYYYHEDDFLNVSYVFNNLPSDRFYKVEYATIINFSSDANVDFSSLNLNIDLPLLGDVYTCNIYNFDDEKHITGQVSSFETTQNGYFVLQNMESYSGSIPFDLSLSYAPSVLREINNHIDIEFIIISVEELTESEAEIYQRAYYEGFDDGQETGYTSGYSNGFSVGESAGYESGYSHGQSDGYRDGYDIGFSSGTTSVDTQQYYDQGFSAGVDSVDTDSFYNSGYQAGLSSGYVDAFDQGYGEGISAGYAEGYAAAQNSFKENVEAGGVSEGESTEIVIDLDLNTNNLKLSDSNVTLGTVYEFNADEDVTHIYDVEEHFDYLSGSFYDSDDDALNDEVVLDFSTIKKYYEKTYTDSFNSYRGWSYFYAGSQKLFTADPEAYAYKITVIPQNISANYTNINWFRNTVGTRSDIMAGTSDIGIGMISGYSDEFTYMITTDNLPVDIYSAFLMYFYNEGTNETHNYAAYDVSGKLKVVITPYSRNEYAAIMSGMDDIQNDINNRFEELEQNLDENFDELTNGYDTSQGDKVNDDFQASLNDYDAAESSLFNSATESLGAYEFFDFASVPAMITGISFVTSLMTGIYTTLGGASGATGIILSILFSVMLISMVLGLSKHYMSGSKSSSSSASKPTRSENDHIKK